MEDLFTTSRRLENLKTLAAKRRKKKVAAKTGGSESDESLLSSSLIERIGGLDFASNYGAPRSDYDIDSELASRSSESIIESVFARSFLDDDGIGLD